MCTNLLAEMMETCSGFGDRVADWLQSVAVLRQVSPGDNDASCIIYETSPTIIDATIDLLGQSESVAVLMGLLDTTGCDYASRCSSNECHRLETRSNVLHFARRQSIIPLRRKGLPSSPSLA